MCSKWHFSPLLSAIAESTVWYDTVLDLNVVNPDEIEFSVEVILNPTQLENHRASTVTHTLYSLTSLSQHTNCALIK